MGKIGLAEGTFALIPEGTHVFKITKVVHKKDFGKVEITMETKEGLKHVERYSLMSSDGSNNDVALRIFSYTARCAMNNPALKEIDSDELVGHYIQADVEHDVQPNKNDPSKTVTFLKLNNKKPSNGFGDEEIPMPKTSAEKKAEAVKAKVDLKALLG